MQVIKRDGTVVDYDRAKIAVAIGKANAEMEAQERASGEEIESILSYIEGKKKKRMLVEDIQDIIEEKLMEQGHYELAKTYIIYRYNRALVRKANTTDEAILSLISNSNKDVMEENSNKNALAAATQPSSRAKCPKTSPAASSCPKKFPRRTTRASCISTTRITLSSPFSTAASSISGICSITVRS